MRFLCFFSIAAALLFSSPAFAVTATLDQDLTWNDVGSGAHYDVKIRNEGDGIVVKTFEAGTATSVGLDVLLAGLDFSVENSFRISVRSKVLLSAGPPATYTLESAYSSELQLTVTGFPVPNTPTVVLFFDQDHDSYAYSDVADYRRRVA